MTIQNVIKRYNPWNHGWRGLWECYDPQDYAIKMSAYIVKFPCHHWSHAVSFTEIRVTEPIHYTDHGWYRTMMCCDHTIHVVVPIIVATWHLVSDRASMHHDGLYALLMP